MPIQSKSVYSSFIDAIAYDSDNETMTVFYQKGGQSTHPVSPDVAHDIWNAPSIGTALHQNVPGFSSVGKRAKSG